MRPVARLWITLPALLAALALGQLLVRGAAAAAPGARGQVILKGAKPFTESLAQMKQRDAKRKASRAAVRFRAAEPDGDEEEEAVERAGVRREVRASAGEGLFP